MIKPESMEDFLSKKPTRMLNLVCDYCQKEFTRQNRTVHNGRTILDKDACVNCIPAKRTEAFMKKSGVKSSFAMQETKDKIKKTLEEKYEGGHSSRDPKVKAKIINTHIEKYGKHATKLQETQDKKISTNLLKYGVEHVSQLKEIKDKTIETNLLKYGVEYTSQAQIAKDKRKQTNLERYNVENYSQTPEYKIKFRNTSLKIFGTDHPCQSQIVKDKIAQTNLKNLGVKSPFDSKLVQEKIKETNIKKYGTPFPSQLQEIKNKIMQTNLKNHGVKYILSLLSIRNKIKETNIRKYNVENTFQFEEFKEKSKETNLNKYGTPFACQSEFIKNKIVQTNLKNLGVKCPFNSELVQNKIKETNIKRYNKENYSQTPEYKIKFKNTCLKLFGTDYPSQSKQIMDKIIHTKIEKYGTAFPNNFGKTENELREFIENSSNKKFPSDYQILEGKEIDLYNEELKLAIEYCGLFWHNELSPQPRLKEYHYNKFIKCNEKGIRLISIFEDEWIKRKEQVKYYLESILGKYEKVIYARKCKLISNIDLLNFCEKWHIQGKPQNSFCSFGLEYDGEIVGVITGGKHHRNFNKFVLSRLCFKPRTRIIGGASKLNNALCNFAKEYGFDEISTWSDNRWSDGKVYKAIGFEFDGQLPPDYSWTKNLSRFSKQTMKKPKDALPEDTEKTYWETRGYARIWDCGKIRWKINL